MLKYPMKPILIYDAQCRLCVDSQKLLRAWDRSRLIDFLPFQDPQSRKWLPEVSATGCLEAMRFVDPQGCTSDGVEAFRHLLAFLPAGRWVARIFLIPGAPKAARTIYRWIARHRYRLFGGTS